MRYAWFTDASERADSCRHRRRVPSELALLALRCLDCDAVFLPLPKPAQVDALDAAARRMVRD